MRCGGIWDLTHVYLEQKLAIKVLLQREICLLKIHILPRIEPEEDLCKTVILPLCHSGDSLICIYRI